MIVIPAGSDAFIIGHNPGAVLSTIGAIRCPEFLTGWAGDLLFATPWAYWAALAGFGAILAYVGRTQKSKGVFRAGVGIVGVALVWGVMGWMVVTTGERLEGAHRRLLDGLAEKNIEKVMGVLEVDFHATPLAIESPKDVRPAIEGAMRNYPVRAARITELKTRMEGAEASTRATIVTDFEALPEIKTTWNLEWSDVAGADWKLRDATLELMNDSPPGDFRLPGRVQ